MLQQNPTALQQIEQRIAQLERENAALRRKKAKAKAPTCPTPRRAAAQVAPQHIEVVEVTEPLPFIFKMAMVLLGMMLALWVLPI